MTPSNTRIGAALTLMEAEIVFRELLKRWPRLSLNDPIPQWNGNPVYRGLTALRLVTRAEEGLDSASVARRSTS